MIHRFRSWNNLSVIGALAYRVRSPQRSRVFLRMHPGAVRSPQIIHFLRHLRRHVRGPIILLWDGLHAHRGLETQAYIRTQSSWLAVHRLPAYAPELNPVEAMWSWFKGTVAANLCPETLEPVRQQLRLGRRRLGRNPDRLQSFLHKAGLFL